MALQGEYLNAGGGVVDVDVDFEEEVGGDRRGEYRFTSLIRNTPLLGPYSRTMSRAIWWP